MRRLSGPWDADNRLPGVLTPMGAGNGVAARVGVSNALARSQLQPNCTIRYYAAID